MHDDTVFLEFCLFGASWLVLLMHSPCVQAALQRGSWRFWPFRSSTSRKVGVPGCRSQLGWTTLRSWRAGASQRMESKAMFLLRMLQCS